jgi:AcrR family transcriptional regulator
MNHNKGSTSTQQRLVEAAVQLFSRQGYNATSTREVALVADVNEASLFRHFSKQDLFWAALRSRLEQVRLRKELQEGLIQVDKPERVVPLIFEFLVYTAVCQCELIRLLNVGFLELRPGTERLYRQHFAPLSCAIHDYLTECGRNGSLRKSVDPSVTTTAFIATVLAHHGMYPLLANNGSPYANAEEAIAAYSTYWLGLLLPDSGTNGSRRAKLAGTAAEHVSSHR